MDRQFSSPPAPHPGRLTVRSVAWQEHQHELLAVRHAVFVQEQGVPVALEHDALDAVAWHFLARAPDGTPVGTARLLADAHIGRLAVLAPWRRHGVGKRLMLAAMADAHARGMPRVCLHAQRQAQAFYETLGFVAQGPGFLEAGIPHVLMVRAQAP